MRILMLTNLYPNPLQPHRGVFNRQQAVALARRHDVRVISPVSWIDELKARRAGATLGNARTRDDAQVVVAYPRYLYTPGLLRRWHGRFYAWSTRAALFQSLETFRPNLLFAAWAYPDAWAAVRFARRAGLPVVVKVHGSDLLMLDRHPDRRPGTIEALCGADHVVAVSRHLASRAASLGVRPEKLTVVYDGIDPTLFYPPGREQVEQIPAQTSPDTPPVVLFVGNLLPVKGLDVLIDACALLRQWGTRFRCRIVGQGPLRDAIASEIARRNLHDIVELAGPVPHADLPDRYRGASLLVLPSRSEGVPVVLLEAAACGTPFVATRVGGIPEIAHLVESELVPPEDATALANAIRRRLRTARSLSRHASPPRTIDDAARDLEKLFHDVTTRSPGRSAPSAPEPQFA